MLGKLGEADISYSDDRWRELIDALTVYPDRHRKFPLKSGDEIEIAS